MHTVVFLDYFVNFLKNIFKSLFASTNVVALSENILLAGFPVRATNHFKTFKKPSVIKSKANSKRTAFTAKYVKTAT